VATYKSGIIKPGLADDIFGKWLLKYKIHT
jgi:hypothetical protein